jgi:hypothetical protein
MKIRLGILLILLTCFSAFAGETKIDGIYFGKNMYVLNSSISNPEDYCISAVSVNGKNISTPVAAASFEIDFQAMGLKPGDKVNLLITTKGNCKPNIINPEVLSSYPSCEFVYTKADKNSINWATKGENGELPFLIQQSKWNRWVTIGEVIGKGLPDSTAYTYQVKHLNGVNLYRVVQKDDHGRMVSSPEMSSRSSNPEILFTNNKGNSITFSEETQFEIYDAAGLLIDSGVTTEVDISSLPKGDYHLAYANKTELIKK